MAVTFFRRVSFNYLDSQSGNVKRRRLLAVKFPWLVLQHVLSKGLRRVRDSGFLRGNANKLLQLLNLVLARAGQGALLPFGDTVRQLAYRQCTAPASSLTRRPTVALPQAVGGSGRHALMRLINHRDDNTSMRWMIIN